MKKTLTLSLMLMMSAVMWAVTDNTTYSLRNGNGALFVKNADMAPSTQVVYWIETDVQAQRWTALSNDDGTWLLTNLRSNYNLRASGKTAGSKVIQAASKTGNSKWTIEPVEGSTDKYYIILNGLYLMPTATSNGSDVLLQEKTTQNEALAQWQFVEDNEIQTGFSTEIRDKMYQDFMAHYRHPAGSNYVLGGGGWWGDAEMFETILDFYETTGDIAYKNDYAKLHANFIARNNTDWTGNDFNDDITWMVLSSIRAYKYFGSKTYLTQARNNYDKMYKRALEPSGTLRWKERDNDTKYGTNSCINCPAVVAACYLYEMTGEEDYLTKAINLYEAQRNHLFDKNDGHVWDAGKFDSNYKNFGNISYWGSTYNQGTMLGAATKLYVLTGNKMYKDDADKVYSWSIKDLTALKGKEHIIKVCQTADEDLQGFKGILMRYIRLYAETFGLEDALAVCKQNAMYAYQNRNKDGVIWSKWLEKTVDNYISVEGDKTFNFNNDPFGASTALSAAANAHVNGMFRKSLADGINVKYMDDLRAFSIAVDEATGEGVTSTSSTTGSYICFKNVIFGAEPVEKLLVEVSNATTSSVSTNTCMKIYIDALNPDNLIGSAHTEYADMTQAEIDIRPTTGVHALYIYVDSENTSLPRATLKSVMAKPKIQVVAGDANGDGNVTVADLTMIASYILGNNIEGFNTEAADMNGDGNVTVADLTLIASAILNAQ